MTKYVLDGEVDLDQVRCVICGLQVMDYADGEDGGEQSGPSNTEWCGDRSSPELGEPDWENGSGHRWEPWSDYELEHFGVKDEFFDVNRWTTHANMSMVPCEQRISGHSYPDVLTAISNALDMGVCVRCGHHKEEGN